MNLPIGLDDRGPALKIFSSYADGLHTSPDEFYDDQQISMSHWMNSSYLLSDLESYDPVPQCNPTSLPPPHLICEDNYSYDDTLDSNLCSWSYDGASSSSTTFPSRPEARLIPNSLSPSPSISIISSSPRSEQSALSSPPALNEFSNVFDFDFGTSLPNEYPTTSSWASIHPGSPAATSATSCSPSPSHSSLDAADAKSATSRDSSPTQSESDPHHQRRRFPCLILGCARRFTSQYTLKVHMEAHKPKPRVSFPCTLGCSERFSRQHDRLRHEVAKHGKVCEFSCEDCGRFFSTKKTLGNHKCPVAQGGTRWVTS